MKYEMVRSSIHVIVRLNLNLIGSDGDNHTSALRKRNEK